MAHTLSVRPSTYRGREGWLLTGSPNGGGRRVRIFFEHEKAARRTFDRLKADPEYPVGMRDFLVAYPKPKEGERTAVISVCCDARVRQDSPPRLPSKENASLPSRFTCKECGRKCRIRLVPSWYVDGEVGG